MTKLEKIEQDIASLAPSDFHKLADWIAEYREELLDLQIQNDVESGKFDKLAEQALVDHRAGRSKPL